MTNDEFSALVSRLEQQAQNNPAGYQFKVLLLALLGNVYLFAVLLLVIALCLGLIAALILFKALVLIKVALFAGFFLWMILKALWVPSVAPAGSPVNAREAPELLAMIDELRRQLGAPRFHHVLITNELNAGVVQLPRLGLFGWPRNYLLIGLPLLKLMTPAQFKAVLAHEFGHLAKGHGRLANWLYCQRQRWEQVLSLLAANAGKGSFLLKPFLNWFVPYFTAYSFPLARANEFEADAIAARLTSPQHAAEALSGVKVASRYLAESYWPGIHRQADELAQPNFAPFQEMNPPAGGPIDLANAENWLAQAMAETTNASDTHPALKDRLHAIGQTPRLALPAAEHAADRLLGQALARITADFDRNWRDNIAPAWEERYQSVQNDRRRLAELDARLAAGEVLNIDDAYQRARLIESSANRPDDALALFRELHAQAPDNALICLTLGARLLTRDDASGCALVEQAMARDENAIISGCELLRDYHWRQENHEAAHAWHQRLIDRQILQQAAAAERDNISLSDKLEPHALDEASLTQLRQALRQIPGLRKAYLFRKPVKHLTHIPCYILGYTASRWYQFHSKKRIAAVLQQIQQTIPFPGETLIINVEGDNYRFGRKMRWKRGARVV